MRLPIRKILPGLSLLACLAAIVLWVHSLSNWDEVDFSPASMELSLLSMDSALDLEVAYDERFLWEKDGSYFHADHYHFTEDRPHSCFRWNTLGFNDSFTKFGPKPFFWCARVTIPYWLIVGLLAILPLRSIERHMRVRRLSKRGLCPVCQYDLRASSQRCPECGTPFTRKQVLPYPTHSAKSPA